jgi:hypothetical protein
MCILIFLYINFNGLSSNKEANHSQSQLIEKINDELKNTNTIDKNVIQAVNINKTIETSPLLS